MSRDKFGYYRKPCDRQYYWMCVQAPVVVVQRDRANGSLSLRNRKVEGSTLYSYEILDSHTYASHVRYTALSHYEFVCIQQHV
jgi:hypothetical protein